MPRKQKTAISATAVARNLSDLLNRIQYRGERFVILRNGQEVAEISPPPETSGTLGDLLERLRDVPPFDDAFAEDLAEIRTHQPEMPDARWDS